MSLLKKVKDALIVDEKTGNPVAPAQPPLPTVPAAHYQPVATPLPVADYTTQPALHDQLDTTLAALYPVQPAAPEPPVFVQPQPVAYYPPSNPSPQMPAPAAPSPVVVQPAPAWPAPSIAISPVYTQPSPRAVSPAVAPAVAPAAAPTAPILPSNVNMDQINAIYQEQGITQAAYGAEQALRFLSAFPDDQLDSNRRAALLGLVDSLKFSLPGLTIESLAEDASNKIAVLEQTGQIRNEKFKKFEADTEREIESLRGQIQQRREAVEVRRVQDQQVTQLCLDHAERLKKLAGLLA